ncbi:MAG: tetratricopeptide repeat protein [Fibrobacteria bacterium]|nr:tetratricopeptide repeat protein [Fibrobacteria bacterium]
MRKFEHMFFWCQKLIWKGFAVTILLCMAVTAQEDLGVILEKIDKYLGQQRYSGAAFLYKKIAKKSIYNDSVRAGSLYSAGLLYEQKMKDYKKAIDVYSRLVVSYPDNKNVVFAQNRVKFLKEQLEGYREADNILSAITYKWGLSTKQAEADLKKLYSLVEDYPQYYNIAKVYAFIGNRYIVLENWGKSFYYCYKAQKSSPFLKTNPALANDYRFAKEKFLYRTGLLWSSIVLFLALILVLWRKSWKGLCRKHVKYTALLLLLWWILAILVFSAPAILGVPVPTFQVFTEPVLVFLWFRPLLSQYFGYFLLYSSVGVVVTLLVSRSFTGLKVYRQYSFSIISSLLVMTAMLTFFYFLHCGDGVHQNSFLYFKKEIEDYVVLYPELFEEYPEILNNIPD